jgi:hypothetical protein
LQRFKGSFKVDRRRNLIKSDISQWIATTIFRVIEQSTDFLKLGDGWFGLSRKWCRR